VASGFGSGGATASATGFGLTAADLTRTRNEGVLWLASVRDGFSNKVVGWDSGPRATTELVCSALDYAIWSRDIRDGRLIHHSDKGSTPRSASPSACSTPASPSTGSVGDSFDNALAENLWSARKIELIYWPATTFTTRSRSRGGAVPLHRWLVWICG
jgi:putative transposase